MQAIDLRQIVLVLIAIYFIYKFIGKPIIGLINSLYNVLLIVKIRDDKFKIIIKFPVQEKPKRNIAEIISMIMLFIVILFLFKSYVAFVLLASLLTVLTEIITPLIYGKYNGIYHDYILYNKRYQFSSIHSWKRVEVDKSISFLGTNGLRFDIYTGNEYVSCINFLNDKKIKEEI